MLGLSIANNSISSGGISGIAYHRQSWTINEGATSNINGDVRWYMANTDVFTYNETGQTPILDPSDNTKLLTNNAFGNLNRVTNDKGAQNYTDVGGGLTSDGATANYAINHYTGHGWALNPVHAGDVDWEDSVTQVQAFTITAYDATVYGSGDYGQFRMPTFEDANDICTGTGNTNILTGIENWGDNFHFIMNSSSATNIFFWRDNQTFDGSTRITVRASNSPLNTIDCIAVRNHY